MSVLIPDSLPNPDELQVLEMRVLRGPNLWSDAPLLECLVSLGRWNELSSELLTGFNQRLVEWLPGLIDHRCSVGERGGFIQRLNRGTYPAHIMEHITIELHSMVGVEIWYGRTRHAGQDGVYRIVFKYKDETLARSCFLAAREVFLAAALNLPLDVGKYVNSLRSVSEKCMLSPDVRALVDAAARRNIPHIRVGDGQLVQFGHGVRQRRMVGMATDRLGAIAATLADDRQLLENQLLSAGVGLKLAEPDAPATLPEYRLLMTGQRLAAALEDKCRDVTEEVHPDFEAAGASILTALHWDTASIDIRVDDIRSPLATQNAVIVRLQPQAEIGIHLQPAEGKARAVDEAILEMLFEAGEDGRIPIIAVVGGSGKTTVARLLTSVLQGTGSCVGLTCAEGVYLGGQRIGTHDGMEAASARGILLHPQAEIAIFETSSDGILREGLAFDQCQVAVVTDVCQVGDAEKFAEIISTIVRVVGPHGVAVLNAAEPLVAGMASKCKGRVLFYALDASEPEMLKHRSEGGQVLFVREGTVILADGMNERAVYRLAEVKHAQSEVEKLLPIIAAACAMRLSAELIAAAL